MFRYIVRRIIMAIPVLIGVTLAVFMLIQIPVLITGVDPIEMMLPFDATNEQIAETRHHYGLDKPLFFDLDPLKEVEYDLVAAFQNGWNPLDSQYFGFVWRALHGNLGKSWDSEVDAWELIKDHLPATIQLSAFAVLIAWMVAIPVGVLSATHQYTVWDNLATTFALIGRAMPNFWIGLLLILIFAVRLGWLPAFGRGDGSLKYYILPAITLSGTSMATMMRLTRSCLLDEFGHDYVRTARAKGLTERTVIYVHAMKNALIPIVTVAGLQVAALTGGAVITETIFAWPGLGRLTFHAVVQRDLPLVQGCSLFIALVFIASNLLVDVLYAFLDPRIRYE